MLGKQIAQLRKQKQSVKIQKKNKQQKNKQTTTTRKTTNINTVMFHCSLLQTVYSITLDTV